MLRNLFLAMLSLVAVGQFALALPAYAQPVGAGQDDPRKLLGDTGLGVGNADPAEAGRQLPALVGRIIRVLLGLLGIIFLVLVVYAGFLWMTARGEKEKVEDAKKIIQNAIIGLVIIFVAYALTGFIVDAVIRATTGV